MPLLGDTEYVAPSDTRTPPKPPVPQATAAGRQVNGAEGAAGSNLNGVASAAGNTEGERILTLDVGDKADSLRGTVNAELTLEETPRSTPGRTLIGALTVTDRPGVIVLGPRKFNGSKAREEREVTVTVIRTPTARTPSPVTCTKATASKSCARKK